MTRRADAGPVATWLLSRAARGRAGPRRHLAAGRRAGRRVPGSLSRWDRWDVGLFRKVAEYGYAGYPQHYPDRGIEAFFPGFPLVLALVHRVVPDWTAAGLLVSLAAGGVACLWLGRLAALDGVDGSRATLYLVLSPYAVFLAAGYSEALFLALALPGWWCARRGHWAAAGLLVAGASAVRVSGLFLAARAGRARRGHRAPAAAGGRPGCSRRSRCCSATPATCTASPATGCAGRTRSRRAGAGTSPRPGTRCTRR